MAEGVQDRHLRVDMQILGRKQSASVQAMHEAGAMAVTLCARRRCAPRVLNGYQRSGVQSST